MDVRNHRILQATDLYVGKLLEERTTHADTGRKRHDVIVKVSGGIHV